MSSCAIVIDCGRRICVYNAKTERYAGFSQRRPGLRFAMVTGGVGYDPCVSTCTPNGYAMGFVGRPEEPNVGRPAGVTVITLSTAMGFGPRAGAFMSR